MKTVKSLIQLFEDKKIRTLFDEENQAWYFSVVDVCGALTEQPTQDRARKYWSVLKARLKKEETQLTTNCSQLKMQSTDGKYYLTDAFDLKGILRVIQFIPSKKATPFKMWIAKVAARKITEKRQARIAAAEETKQVAVETREKSKVRMILWGLGIFAVLVGAVLLIVLS